MKGLLLRDLYLNKKFILLPSIIAFIFEIYLLKINLQAAHYIAIYIFLIVLFSVSAGENLMINNKTYGWKKFVFASPIKSAIIVKEQYIFQIIFAFLGFINASLFLVIYNLITNNPYTLSQFEAIIFAIDIALIRNALFYFYCKFNPKLASLLIYSILGIFIIIGFFCISAISHESGSLIFVCCFILGMFLNIFSCKICIKQFHRIIG